ncbi:MAG: carboxypeptidase regulatory-like domain-containing protein [Acidobacteria bacterium]|nr:carboxypeptidase regulatory-like domain-containing protein [Acidobacteriota bacterium]
MGSSRLVLATVVALPLLAQDPRGFIKGTVADNSGGVIPGVKVRATANDTGVSAVAQANESGLFNIPYLIPGMYRVHVEHTGFKAFVRNNVEVRVSETTELTIPLEVGLVTEIVEVRDTTPQLETANASLGLVMDQRRINDLPQRGGNPLELTLLAPGVANTTNLRLRKSMAPEATSDFAADGAGRYNNEFQIDGISNTAADRGRGYARVAYAPPASAVREFKMQTSAYDASVGHTMGSIVNVSTASGTNELHGEAHWFLRHSALDAPNFFNNKNGTPQPLYQDNRYGFSLGGPIRIPKVYDGRNKTFFFFAYEGNQFGVPTQFSRTVPTAAQRNGDFSALLPLTNANYAVYDPRSTTPAPNGRFARTPFAGNVIPRSRLDALGMNLANLYPLPNSPPTATADGRNNYFSFPKAIQKTYSNLVRFDHAVNENHRLFLRAHYDFWKEDKNHDFLNEINGIHQNRPNRGAAIDDVLVLGPTMVLNLRYGFTSTKWWQYRTSRGYDLGSLGFSPQLVALTEKGQAPLPRISPGAYSQLSWWEDPGDGVNSSLTHTATANVTRMRGSHSIRFGTEYRVYRSFNNRRPAGVSPDISFNTNFTRGPLDNSPAAPIGQDLASMLLGVPAGSMEIAANSALQNKFLGLYVHDDWKYSRNLTFNIGIRYELETPVTERYDRLQAFFDQTTPNPVNGAARANYARNPIPDLPAASFQALGGTTYVSASNRSPFQGQKRNFMPRFGFAFQLTPKTIVRGGYGIFFNSLGINTTIPYQTGFTQSTPIQASLDNGLTYVATTASPFPTGLIAPRGTAGGLATNLGQGLTTYLFPNKQGYAQRWSLDLQRILPGQLLLDTSYVANRGTRLDVARSFNATPNEVLSRSPVRDQPRIDFLSQQFPNPFRGTDPIFGANISRANLLRPYPQFGALSQEEPIGYSWYHSLQVRAERRFVNGFTFQLAYTWAKLMEASEFMNEADALPYESISAFDRPHRIASSGIWEIPFGKGRKFAPTLPAPVDFFLGGWQIGAIVAVQSGQALGFGNAIFNGNIQDINLPSGQRHVDRWFNEGAGFNRNANQQLASNYRLFPLRFSSIRGPNQNSWDFSIVKSFPVGERFKVQFRADAYNAWNHTNFNNPNTTPTNTAFGRITGTAGDSRNWQMSLRVTF